MRLIAALLGTVLVLGQGLWVLSATREYGRAASQPGATRGTVAARDASGRTFVLRQSDGSTASVTLAEGSAICVGDAVAVDTAGTANAIPFHDGDLTEFNFIRLLTHSCDR